MATFKLNAAVDEEIDETLINEKPASIDVSPTSNGAASTPTEHSVTAAGSDDATESTPDRRKLIEGGSFNATVESSGKDSVNTPSALDKFRETVGDKRKCPWRSQNLYWKGRKNYWCNTIRLYR